MTSQHPGMRRLVNIRSFAAGLAAELEPRTRRRFDGVERLEPDPDAMEQLEILLALGKLIDGITADPDFLMRAVRILAR